MAIRNFAWSLTVGLYAFVLIHVAVSMMVCMTCRPVELQNAPGIGVDITMAYISAAIQFRNSTIRDFVNLDGTVEYITAMQSLATDARKVKNGGNSSLEHSSYRRLRKPLPSPLQESLQMVPGYKLLIDFLYPQPQFEPARPGSWISTIAAALSQLQDALRNIDPPLKYNLVTITFPDFLAGLSHIYVEDFAAACKMAGFDLQIHSIASDSLLVYYGVQGYYDDDFDNELTGGPSSIFDPTARVHNVILSITYNKASLGITLLTRWLGTPRPSSISENFHHGSDCSLRSEDPVKYWNDVKDFIEDAIPTEQITTVIIQGSHAQDPDLRRALVQVFDKHEYAKGFLATKLGEFGDQSDSLFATAREAAQASRFGMQTGFEACIVPDECPRAEDVKEIEYSYVDRTKSEL